MSLDDAEIKAIQQANEALHKQAAEMITALYQEAAGKTVIACGQCHEPTAAVSAKAKTIIQDSLFGDSLYPDVTQVKMALVCPRCFELQ